MSGHWRLVAPTILALLAAAPAPSGSRQDASDCPMKNYGVVWDGKLTRSGLPDDDEGWDWLHEQGVKSVVVLSAETDVPYATHGLSNVLRIPLSDGEEDLPTDRQISAFLAFIQDPKNQPVHVHCAAGRDRTGMMVALARYAVDGWPLDKALAEARTYRDGKRLSAWRIAWLRAWAQAHRPGSARIVAAAK